jgi:hexosaminidase
VKGNSRFVFGTQDSEVIRELLLRVLIFKVYKMKIKSIKWLFGMMIVFFSHSHNSFAEQKKIPGILPAPASANPDKGFFRFNGETKIFLQSNDSSSLKIAHYLAEQVNTFLNLKLSIITSSRPGKNTIVLKTGYVADKTEAYSLLIKKKEITIDGASSAGLFYGVQTLLQILYPEGQDKSNIRIACTEITDAPSFAWRGLHLDVCRHFYSIEFVKKMIDMMAMLKLNTFHWHLTDDQGWRIEIKRYPELSRISAWRDETMVGHYTETGQQFDGIRYGGYYTQDQIRDVVKYAQDRYITIIPEIEMPGHAVAALSAYPQFSCTGGPFKVYTKWGVSEDVYCAGKEGTFEFLENVLDEVIALFPGKYIHIGGDECPKTRWKSCSFCQKRIKDEGLKDELELQSYFVKRIERFVASKGKSMMGWDEILEGGLPERASVMSWRGYEGGIEAAHTGHDVVMTPTDFCYFDHYQSQDKNEPLAIGGFLPLEKVYSFNPLPPALSIEGAKHILGAQANLWTEYIADEKKAEYMIFPRLCAMAEVLWTPKGLQNYPDFLIRLGDHLKRLQKLGVNYRPL